MSSKDKARKDTHGKPSGRRKRSEKSERERFFDVLYARAPAEDLRLLDNSSRASAAQMAMDALMRHEKGDSVLSIESDGNVSAGGEALSVVTMVNDNMPFLFDSLVSEIADSAGEPVLVLHPILHLIHGSTAAQNVVCEISGQKTRQHADRVSIIQVHVVQLSETETKALAGRLEVILEQVRAAVFGWKPMLARLDKAIADYRYSTSSKSESLEEAVSFLEWLRDDNFTFLGMREYDYSGGAKRGVLTRSENTGLGILNDLSVRVLRRGQEEVSTTPEIRAFLNGPEPLIVTKANTKSLVHRRAYMDYVGVKSFDTKGKVTGELRIVGLFTSTAYTRSVLNIPYLRSKVQVVVDKAGFSPDDHSGKSLLNVLESYPRDELFQIDATTLTRHALAILTLSERPRVRVLSRLDPFGRFVSAIVFVPRDRYDSRIREQIGDYLKNVYEGRLSAYYPAFPEGTLVRVHFIIGLAGGEVPKVSSSQLESDIRQIVRTWEDTLREVANQNGTAPDIVRVARCFPEEYRGSFTAATALQDAKQVQQLDDGNPIAVDFYRHGGHTPQSAALKIYHYGLPVSLSRRVPMLENMAFRVISERTFAVTIDAQTTIYIHDMELEHATSGTIDISDEGKLFEQLFMDVWRGAVDNDRYNGLVQTARLPVASIVVLRSYGRYLQQAGIPFSQEFIALALNRYPNISVDLVKLFAMRLDPKRAGKSASKRAVSQIESRIERALRNVPSLDDDQIIRRLANLIQATLRTNAFAGGESVVPRALAFKLAPRLVDGLPEPRPWREIFVYGAEVEGVHLRFGPVARGGLRWSDRAQDYRTEVLGLVKAQQVKNAVIVPVGSKGGFFPKSLPKDGTRAMVYEAGRQAYITFVSSLLSLTDNLASGKIVPPAEVFRHDNDDPYLVVAADKGTAAFSDTANAVSERYGFWLDDAFASGGSAGYDHKKMGITARGAWEAVKRHFREMNLDIQNQSFTVVGIGDMSGDVFGNGMLLSRHIRLLAAFDHRDIFIDPDPDPAISFSERKKLFEKPRSSWDDYNREHISEGGGVYSRSLKSITLSQTAADAIGFGKTVATPNEVMQAILKAQVELLWFGGIGTYVRASGESDRDVGDKTNDAIRIVATELRTKVVGEGANLGMSQKARIEFGLSGGRCNSDAIDNSGGVNTSDLEVNIKIALADAMRNDKLEREERNRFLSVMTEDVAELVLQNNYNQTLAISLTQRRGLADIAYQGRFMNELETRGLLNRAVETLPDEAALSEREVRGQPLTRAEIGVLLSYAKIVLFDDILTGKLTDDPHLEMDLFRYFPAPMVSRFDEEIRDHRLRREIIATELSNDAINRGGPTFISRLRDLTGASSGDVVRAFVIVRNGFELPELFSRVDSLDNKIDGSAQNGFYAEISRLLHSATAWYLRNGDNSADIGMTVEQLRQARQLLEPKLSSMLPPRMRESQAARTRSMRHAGAPGSLAKRLAGLGSAETIPDIALVAKHAGADMTASASAFFSVMEAFQVGRIQEAAQAISITDYYDGLAMTRALGQIAQARRALAVMALQAYGGQSDPVARWMKTNIDLTADSCDRIHALVEGGDLTVSRLTVIAGLMDDLVDK